MQNYLMYILIFICLNSGHNTLLGCDNNNNKNNHTINPKSKRKALTISPTSSDAEYTSTSDFESDSSDSEDLKYISESDDESSNPKSHGGFSKSFSQQSTQCKKAKSESKSKKSIPGTYVICTLCAGQPDFLNAKSKGRRKAIFTSYNSYSNNSRKTHAQIYSQFEKTTKGGGAKWLQANSRILKCDPNLSLSQVAFQFKNQLRSHQDLDGVIKDWEQKENARLKKKGNNQFFAEE